MSESVNPSSSPRRRVVEQFLKSIEKPSSAKAASVNPSSAKAASVNPSSAQNPSSAKADSFIARYLKEKKEKEKDRTKPGSAPNHGVGNPGSAKPPGLPKPITEALNTLDNPPFNLPDIKRAYRKLALMLHPDKNGNTPEATDAFRKIHEAYETLTAYLSKQKGGSNRQKYRKTKKTQKLRHKKHHRKTHRVRV